MQAGYAKNKSSAAIIQACRCDWSLTWLRIPFLLECNPKITELPGSSERWNLLSPKCEVIFWISRFPNHSLKKAIVNALKYSRRHFVHFNRCSIDDTLWRFDDHRAILFLVSWLVSVASLSFVLRKTRGCLWRETVFLRASNGLHSFTAGIIVWFAVLARTVSRYAIAFASRPEHICVFASIRIASAKRYHRASLRP